MPSNEATDTGDEGTSDELARDEPAELEAGQRAERDEALRLQHVARTRGRAIGRQDERAAVVAWLRFSKDAAVLAAADAIERGEHDPRR